MLFFEKEDLNGQIIQLYSLKQKAGKPVNISSQQKKDYYMQAIRLELDKFIYLR